MDGWRGPALLDMTEQKYEKWKSWATDNTKICNFLRFFSRVVLLIFALAQHSGTSFSKAQLFHHAQIVKLRQSSV